MEEDFHYVVNKIRSLSDHVDHAGVRIFIHLNIRTTYTYDLGDFEETESGVVFLTEPKLTSTRFELLTVPTRMRLPNEYVSGKELEFQWKRLRKIHFRVTYSTLEELIRFGVPLYRKDFEESWPQCTQEAIDKLWEFVSLAQPAL